MRWTHIALISTVILLDVSIAGCSTQAKRVDCDGTLKPINRPAPTAPAKELPPSDEKPSHEK